MGLLIALGVVLLLGTVGLLAFAYLRARILLTPLRKPLSKTPAQLGLAVEDVRIPSPRGALAAWYLPARNGCTLLCCHGIHDNRGQWIEQVARLHARGGIGHARARADDHLDRRRCHEFVAHPFQLEPQPGTGRRR